MARWRPTRSAGSICTAIRRTADGGCWRVPAPFVLAGTGTSHGTSYFYDRHVPLVFYGLPFAPGVYRAPCEPVDMAATLASLLGINAPSASAGRVLTEALRRESAR